MSDFKGVPGPWTIGVSTRHGVHCVDAVDPKDGLLFEVCEVWGIDHNAEETHRSKANARLIAAAPELLEACQALLAYHDSADDDGVQMMLAYAKAIDQARGAVDKALGNQ